MEGQVLLWEGSSVGTTSPSRTRRRSGCCQRKAASALPAQPQRPAPVRGGTACCPPGCRAASPPAAPCHAQTWPCRLHMGGLSARAWARWFDAVVRTCVRGCVCITSVLICARARMTCVHLHTCVRYNVFRVVCVRACARSRVCVAGVCRHISRVAPAHSCAASAARGCSRGARTSARTGSGARLVRRCVDARGARACVRELACNALVGVHASRGAARVRRCAREPPFDILVGVTRGSGVPRISRIQPTVEAANIGH